ncbi:regulatory protein RecX [Acidipropionibacterium virtanenii]|uniref:Regulatory protein RecX n=1 Tax=Acidipropionibacterium virtanenii TaxID=2057246 RepID=A0A344UUL9_9ACTN|nr:regulatory protein RecX [Acidipropionibacterium virtanenii]AXE38967.1 Regulatory protein RecX [Acidipropionibacterium virtanenii]
MALTRLDARARTRAELAGTLAGKQVPEEVAGRVLDRLEELGLVDDTDFAERWTTRRHESKGLSRRALAEELRRKGVDQQIVADAVAAVSDDDEVSAATRLAVARLRAGEGVEEQRLTRRVLGALARKGYGSEVAWTALRRAREVLGEEAEGPWS